MAKVYDIDKQTDSGPTVLNGSDPPGAHEGEEMTFVTTRPLTHSLTHTPRTRIIYDACPHDAHLEGVRHNPARSIL